VTADIFSCSAATWVDLSKGQPALAEEVLSSIVKQQTAPANGPNPKTQQE